MDFKRSTGVLLITEEYGEDTLVNLLISGYPDQLIEVIETSASVDTNLLTIEEVKEKYPTLEDSNVGQVLMTIAARDYEKPD